MPDVWDQKTIWPLIVHQRKRAQSWNRILSNVAKSAPHNEPRDLLSRLYREIGISAVAAALQVSDEVLDARSNPKQKRAELLQASKAA